MATKSIVSPSPVPAGHSPDIAPEAVSVFAASIASRREQNPSSPTVSVAIVTAIVVAATAGAPFAIATVSGREMPSVVAMPMRRRMWRRCAMGSLGVVSG